ncbi:unnamed protein product [Parnassius apollo]|uniref:(apollo) hypothetical protein n=1 Tax=Parnassius apollo TaxID=110799 RepID=A0A8S3XW19_PARAO|nr:unnamed protein product [Parnassius apollo]
MFAIRKKVKMTDKPKRPMSAYMLWLNSAREQIKADNPGLRVTEIAKKGGEIWKSMTDKSVWEEKAAKAKEQYTKDLESYNANGGGGEGGLGGEAAEAKVQYTRDLESHNANGGGGEGGLGGEAAEAKEQYTRDLECKTAGFFRVMKKVKMTDKPKRPMSAYMLWLNSAREQIKADNPGLRVTEIAKKGGEIWKSMTDKSVWEEKAAKAKEQYTKDLESYNANGGGGEGGLGGEAAEAKVQYTRDLESHDANGGGGEGGLGGEAAEAKEQYTRDLECKTAGFFRVMKKVKMTDKPKCPMSAYMLWLNSAREQIKADNPGLKVTEIARKGGEIWKSKTDKSVWEEKAAKAKEQYTKDLESYNANGGGGEGGLGGEAAEAKEQYTRDLECKTAGFFRVMKKVKMTDKPKRPMSAYMLWLNSAREQIKADNPGLKVTEIARKGGEIWKSMTDKSVWEEKAAKAKEQYTKDLESYNANGGGGEGGLGGEAAEAKEQYTRDLECKTAGFFRVMKKVKMTDKPKRPMSAYMLWLNSAREQIKADNPGLKVTEIARKGGEIWRSMTDKSVWEEKTAKAKEQYTRDLESHDANGGGGEGGLGGEAAEAKEQYTRDLESYNAKTGIFSNYLPILIIIK